MEFVKLRTPDPLEHLPRTLDILRRMGFHLNSATVESDADMSWSLKIFYEQRGHLSAATFVERIRQIPGVRQVKGGQR